MTLSQNFQLLNRILHTLYTGSFYLITNSMNLCPVAHAEALTNIMLFLQRESPTSNLIKHILSRESKVNDFFVVSVLNFWTQNYSEKLSELISSYLTTKVNSPAKRNKRYCFAE